MKHDKLKFISLCAVLFLYKMLEQTFYIGYEVMKGANKKLTKEIN